MFSSCPTLNSKFFFSPQHPSLQKKVLSPLPLRVSISEEPDKKNHQDSKSRDLVKNSSSSSLEPLPLTTTPQSAGGVVCSVSCTQNPSLSLMYSQKTSTPTTTAVQQPVTSSEIDIVEETDDGSQEGIDFDCLFNTPPRGVSTHNQSQSPEIFPSLEGQHVLPSANLSASSSGKLKQVATVMPMSSKNKNTKSQKDKSDGRYNIYALFGVRLFDSFIEANCYSPHLV